MQRQTKHKIGRLNIWLIVALTCAGLMTSVSLDVPDAAATYSQRPADTTQDLPDLVFESVTLDPPNPQIGDTINVQMVIKNQGNAASDGFRVYLYWNPTDQPPTVDTEDTTQTLYGVGLEPGQDLEWRRQVDVTSSDLTHYAWIDRDNEVYESNEENNLYRYPPLSPTPAPTEEYPPTVEPTPTYEPTVEPTVGPTPQYYPDEYEDDDVCNDATEIATDGTSQQHNLFLTDSDVDGDFDWVRFEAVSGETYHIVASPNGDDGSDAMMALEVINDCEEDPGGAFGGNDAEFRFTANQNGTHYVLVRHDDNNYGPKTDYTLTIIAENSCEDFYEPNDSCPRSNDLLVDKDAQTYRFCQPNDVDWMHFEARAGLEYQVSFENRGDVADAQIEVHGTCDIQEPSPLGETESLQFYANTDGPIYLRLANRDSSRYGPDTEYAVQVQQVGESACGPDEYEQDDDLTSAQPIDIASGNFSQTHNACPANEADWMQFQATAGKTYLIETTDLGQSADPVACLYDSERALIECDKNGGLGNGAKLIWQAEADGTYYIEIKDEDDAVAGPDTAYTLHVNTNLCGGALHEPNDGSSQATIIQIDNSQLHTFCQEADEDWIKFEANTGNYVITANPGENGVDTVLALYDPNGNKVAENNDTSDGFGSRIEYQVNSPGTYHIMAYAHDPNSYGSAVEYNVTVQYEPPPTTPDPTPEPTPSPSPTPTPPPSDTRTLILVNGDLLAQLHGENAVEQIQEKLAALAAHERVRGEIIQLQETGSVSAAYAAWLGDLNDVQLANAVADAIKRVLLNHLDTNGGIEYVVLVGDDRALPFRRVIDPTADVRRDFTERQYTGYGSDHPTAAALSQDYILTDDFYIDREMEDFYVPDMDLAIGRLIESPSQIITTIDQFLVSPDTKVERALVTGYDFLVDSGENMCQRWQDDVDASSNVNCEMISQDWSGNRLRQAQRDEIYQIQSINGHALHNLEGAPDQSNVSGDDIASGTSPIGGSLLYTLGCHGGLNVPGMMDLPESFIIRGGTYIGNTGYGWGFRGGIGLSEQLMELLTFNLTEGTQATIGNALVSAKHLYILDQSTINKYDEKILQQVILYGLPMRRVLTSASLAAAPLPSQQDALFEIEHTPFQVSAAQNDVPASDIRVVRQSEFDDTMSDTPDGIIYSLDGQTITDPGQAIMPANYSKDINLLAGASMPDARSLVLKSGQYTTQQDFNPVIATAYNEYTVDNPSEDPADLTDGWSPTFPMVLSRQGGNAQVISSLGQYETATQRVRLFDELRGQIYFSDSPDEKAPRITLVSGVPDAVDSKTTVKVGVEDESGVMSVFVSWFEEESDGSGKIVTQALTSESDSLGWSGSVNHDMANGFFVQAVDNEGNVSVDHNDGYYYLPSSEGTLAPLSIQVDGTSDEEENQEDSVDVKVYLPVVVR